MCWPQSDNQAQNLDELGSGDSNLRELKCDAVAMKYHLGTDLMSLLRGVVRDQCSTSSGSARVRYWLRVLNNSVEIGNGL